MVERFYDMKEVVGSLPAFPTRCVPHWIEGSHKEGVVGCSIDPTPTKMP
jgi:hypothetical protein